MGAEESGTNQVGIDVITDIDGKDIVEMENEMKEIKNNQDYFANRSNDIANAFKSEMYLDNTFLTFIENCYNEIEELNEEDLDSNNSNEVSNRCKHIIREEKDRRFMENIESKKRELLEANKIMRIKLEEADRRNEEIKLKIEELQKSALI